MAEEGFFSRAREEEEKETMRARCRKEVFEYSGVIPSQLVGKHLSASSSVLLSHQKTNNNSLVVSSSSSSLSFEQRVMQTQERLLERCERREEEEEEDALSRTEKRSLKK